LAGAVVCTGIAAATLAATAGGVAAPSPPATIAIGFAGGAQPVTPIATSATTAAAPSSSTADDPQTAWLRRVARGGPASPPPAVAPSSQPPAIAPAVAAPPPSVSLREASRAVHVVVYTTSWCPHCKRAKAWMNGNGVAFEERDIESSRRYAEENRRINPRGSIPTFSVDDEVMTGFAEQDLAATILRAAHKRATSQ
jgi:glutaredoxin